MFKFNITLTDDDYFEYNKYTFLNSPTGKKSLFRQRLQLPIMSAFALIIFFIAKADSTLIITEAIFLAIISILGIIFSKFFFLKRMRRSFNKRKKLEKLPFDEDSTLLFENEAIISTTAESEMTTKYSRLERIIESDKAVYLYVDSVRAYIIPLRTFSSDVDKQQFINFIKSKIDENN